MPSPTETLLRTQLSPEPAHTVFGLRGSMATEPVDCTDALSNTGLKVVPPFTDFQTPPDAVAAYTVKLSPSRTAVTAAMRPLICADPILRAGSPEMVPASYRTARCPKSEVARRSI